MSDELGTCSVSKKPHSFVDCVSLHLHSSLHNPIWKSLEPARQPEKCPTCSSDDPDLLGLETTSKPTGNWRQVRCAVPTWTCADPWHKGQPEKAGPLKRYSVGVIGIFEDPDAPWVKWIDAQAELEKLRVELKAEREIKEAEKKILLVEVEMNKNLIRALKKARDVLGTPVADAWRISKEQARIVKEALSIIRTAVVEKE